MLPITNSNGHSNKLEFQIKDLGHTFTLLLKQNNMLPKITTAIAVFGFLSLQGQAQLNVQSGATFFMQAGAQVTVQGDVQNAGTLNNDGSLRVQGNYTNTGTYTAVGTAGVLEMYGTGNANLAPGASQIANLTINKAAATDVVTLTASTTVNTGFTFTQGVLTTNPTVTPAVALISPATTPYNFAAGKEVVGSVTRTGWSNGAARVFNQPNMLVTTNAGTNPTSVTVTMIPNGDPTQSEREVKRKFNFAQTGGTGFTADVRYPYATGELNTNNEPGMVPWTLVTAEWNARTNAITKDAANNWVNITAIPAAELAQEWKLADQNYTMNVTAHLRGSWSGNSMVANLNSSNLLPLTQPYNDASFNNYNGGESVAAGFFASRPNIIDWVLIEFRKPASGLPGNANFASSIGRRAAFLTTAGTIVDLDGVTPITVPLTKQGAGFVVVKHRNHLGIMSNSLPSNAVGTYANDFSSIANYYDNVSATSDPAQLMPGSSPAKYGLWGGNANKDAIVNAGDIALVKSNANISLNGYVFGDVNMDGTVNAGDVGVTKISANGTAQTHAGKTASGVKRENKEPSSHIPNN